MPEALQNSVKQYKHRLETYADDWIGAVPKVTPPSLGYGVCLVCRRARVCVCVCVHSREPIVDPAEFHPVNSAGADGISGLNFGRD